MVRRGCLASILAGYLANETHIYTLKLGKSRNSILYLKKKEKKKRTHGKEDKIKC